MGFGVLLLALGVVVALCEFFPSVILLIFVFYPDSWDLNTIFLELLL